MRVLWPATSDDYERWVELLADPLRAQRARWHLILSGAPALAAVREGLHHSNADVRVNCALVLDHLVDGESFADLITMLGDPDARVRINALHALACDRCKDTECRPSEGDVLGPAIAALRGDPDPHARGMAAEVVGRWVHTNESAAAALVAARDDDPAPAVRKKAGWYAPGGPIFAKTRPRLSRVRG